MRRLILLLAISVAAPAADVDSAAQADAEATARWGLALALHERTDFGDTPESQALATWPALLRKGERPPGWPTPGTPLHPRDPHWGAYANWVLACQAFAEHPGRLVYATLPIPEQPLVREDVPSIAAKSLLWHLRMRSVGLLDAGHTQAATDNLLLTKRLAQRLRQTRHSTGSFRLAVIEAETAWIYDVARAVPLLSAEQRRRLHETTAPLTASDIVCARLDFELDYLQTIVSGWTRLTPLQQQAFWDRARAESSSIASCAPNNCPPDAAFRLLEARHGALVQLRGLAQDRIHPSTLPTAEVLADDQRLAPLRGESMNSLGDFEQQRRTVMRHTVASAVITLLLEDPGASDERILNIARTACAGLPMAASLRLSAEGPVQRHLLSGEREDIVLTIGLPPRNDLPRSF